MESYVKAITWYVVKKLEIGSHGIKRNIGKEHMKSWEDKTIQKETIGSSFGHMRGGARIPVSMRGAERGLGSTMRSNGLIISSV